MSVRANLKEPATDSVAVPVRKKAAKRKYLYKKPRRRRVATHRKCRICGKDPYPNYFFCPSCHRSVSHFEDN